MVFGAAPPLAPGKVALKLVEGVGSARAGDVATASHDALGMGLGVLSANVAADGRVQVMLRNVEETATLDVGRGTLRVVVSVFA
jgi:hypothetical protein